VTGKLLKAFPAADYYPAYGLSQDDLRKLDQLCETSLEREPDQRRWCLADHKVQRVRSEYQQLWLAKPYVSNVAVEMVGNPSDFMVGLTLQVRCPGDVATIEARVPDEVEGVPVAVEPITGRDVRDGSQSGVRSKYWQRPGAMLRCARKV
jgi:hypothetical protein